MNKYRAFVFLIAALPVCAAGLVPAVRFEMHPKDCHLGIVEANGRSIHAGIETIGDPRSVEARQAVTMVVYDQGLYTDPIFISEAGTVYFPAMVVGADGTVWVAWSEFVGGAWRIMTRTWDRGTLGKSEQVSGPSEVSLQPALAALPGGEVYVAWESGVNGRFQIQGRSWKNGRWSAVETLGGSTGQEFRPAVSADSNGALWLAFDRATAGSYETTARVRADGRWSREIEVFSGSTRAPQIRPDASGRMWILASGRLAGLDRNGQRYELSNSLEGWKGGPEFFAIDSKSRFWFFKALSRKTAFDWMPVGTAPRTGIAVVDSAGAHQLPEMQASLGYSAPTVDEHDTIWIKNDVQYLVLARPYLQAAGAAAVHQTPLSAPKPEREPARQWPRYEVNIDGKQERVWWAEMHNHLQELPTDRVIDTWVDQLYLSARYRDGLDMVAITDHDWPGMSRSMYYVEQGIASVLNAPGAFLAFRGFEWSGDSQTRGRYGDRTVIFPEGYFDIFRITSNAANTNGKLHSEVKKAGGIDWPHHIGYVGNHVNPSEVFPDTEPVIEMTSNHGVFETYDKQHAVPVPIRRPIQPGTSAQDVLAAGKRIGMVGSSDSHIGFSGYRTGMFGVVAPELTTSAILDAIRKRRTIAIRGGEPIFVDLRADGHFIGDEYRTNRPPRLQIKVKATRPVRRIEIIRSNLFVLSQEYSGEATERSLEFADREFPPAFYYVRVQQGDDGWAWTSPVWVDRTMRATAFPEGTATPWASALLMIALLPALLYRRRPA